MTEADDLKKAHAQLVKQRPSIIGGQTENHIDLLVKIQAAIEVLDTLADEDEDEEDDEDDEDDEIGFIAVDGMRWVVDDGAADEASA